MVSWLVGWLGDGEIVGKYKLWCKWCLWCNIDKLLG